MGFTDLFQNLLCYFRLNGLSDVSFLTYAKIRNVFIIIHSSQCGVFQTSHFQYLPYNKHASERNRNERLIIHLFLFAVSGNSNSRFAHWGHLVDNYAVLIDIAYTAEKLFFCWCSFSPPFLRGYGSTPSILPVSSSRCQISANCFNQGWIYVMP